MNLLAMFVVVPKLSQTPGIFGIYSVVISFAIFFTYADLGFISAGIKYAGECFGRGDQQEEVKLTGFVCFVLSIFTAFCALVFIVLSIDAGLIIKDLVTPRDKVIASQLLLILAFFSPVTVVQRFLQIVYGVRVENFINQRIQIVASAIKILSVFYFFGNGRYDIVGYYFFFQLMNAFAVGVSSFVVYRRYHYDYGALLKSFRYSTRIYHKIKKLAINSLYSMVTHVAYYELDFLIIGKMLGAEQVAVYAIGFTIQSFVRNLFGTLFSPFTARFNHFIGRQDEAGLKGLLYTVIVLTLPLTALPILSMTVLMPNLVGSWVGNDYALSVIIGQFLVLSFLYSCISYPAGSVLIAYEKIKTLYITGTTLPAVYWLGVMTTVNIFGVSSFAINKFVAHTVVNLLYIVVLNRILKVGFKAYSIDIFLPTLISGGFLIVLLSFIKPYLPIAKGILNLAYVIGAGAIAAGLSILLFAILSQRVRNYSWILCKRLLVTDPTTS